MKIITMEEHYIDRRIMNANNSFNKNQTLMSPEREEAMKFLISRAFPEELFDFEEKRIPYMDWQRIDMQVLSYTSPVSDLVPADEAVKICRMANDITKQHMDEHPDRFLGFATLPMADPKAAAQELERCVKELGFCGVLLAGRYKGRFYNEEEFFPIFEKAAELDVPVSFHPAFIPMEVQKAYYMSDAYSYDVGMEFASAGYGWHSEVGIQIMRLILSGIFDRLPNLKFISGHWGETIPAFLDRMDIILDQKITGLQKRVSEYYKEHVYITPSGIMSIDQLEYIVKLMGADHVLYAVDYPYMKPQNVYEFLMESSLTDEEKELIAYKNAERLLHLEG
jgi:predicted TIM-barrel fold metal-dependent hydrolase